MFTHQQADMSFATKQWTFLKTKNKITQEWSSGASKPWQRQPWPLMKRRRLFGTLLSGTLCMVWMKWYRWSVFFFICTWIIDCFVCVQNEVCEWNDCSEWPWTWSAQVPQDVVLHHAGRSATATLDCSWSHDVFCQSQVVCTAWQRQETSHCTPLCLSVCVSF